MTDLKWLRKPITASLSEKLEKLTDIKVFQKNAIDKMSEMSRVPER